MKHISNYECQPEGSVNPRPKQHTTPVTLLIRPFFPPSLRFASVNIDWSKVRGGVWRRCRLEDRRLRDEFWLSHDQIHGFWSQADQRIEEKQDRARETEENEIKQTAEGTLVSVFPNLQPLKQSWERN